MNGLQLPEPIAAYFAADRRDSGAVAQCFTPAGVVVDEGQTHTGLVAIEAWKAAAAAKYTYTSEPLATEQEDGRHIVTTRVAGNFPGSPIDLRFAFRLEGDKIGSLEITA